MILYNFFQQFFSEKTVKQNVIQHKIMNDFCFVRVDCNFDLSYPNIYVYNLYIYNKSGDIYVLNSAWRCAESWQFFVNDLVMKYILQKSGMHQLWIIIFKILILFFVYQVIVYEYIHGRLHCILTKKQRIGSTKYIAIEIIL